MPSAAVALSAPDEHGHCDTWVEGCVDDGLHVQRLLLRCIFRHDPAQTQAPLAVRVLHEPLRQQACTAATTVLSAQRAHLRCCFCAAAAAADVLLLLLLQAQRAQ